MNEDLERRVEERTATLEEKEAQLHQARKMEAVGRLAGGVAHDFNNLLTVILGSTDLLLADLPEDRPERAEVEQVREAAESAATLTRQLLAFSRKQVMKPEILDVNDCVQGMRGMLERVLGEQIDIVWRLGARAPSGQVQHGTDPAGDHEPGEGLRVVYMAGYTDDAIVHHGVLEEGTAFLEKPFRVRTLLGRVQEEMDGADA